ncbi:MAG: hypothetical protein ACON47_10115 [Flavobacteriaceae bacterium]
MPKKLQANDSLQDLLQELNNRLNEGHYNDSVHKIKLLTAKEVVERILEESS